MKTRNSRKGTRSPSLNRTRDPSIDKNKSSTDEDGSDFDSSKYDIVGKKKPNNDKKRFLLQYI